MGAFRSGPRAIDHIVMPVRSLEWARQWFERLGFTVAADALHPFGTENACVFFADGTYVEPLAVAHRETCEAEARSGNVFVARDQAYRFRRGEPGFSAVALKSKDAEADNRAFEAAGWSAGGLLEFSRTFSGPDGAPAELSFRLAFAADLRAPDVFFFACQPLNRLRPDRSHLQDHANGATGLSRLVLSEPNPTDFQYFLQDVLNQRNAESHSFGLALEGCDARIEVLTPDGLETHYGAQRDEARGLRIEGLVLKCRDMDRTAHVLRKSGMTIETRGDRLIVRLADDGSAFIAFEAEREE